MILQEGTLGMGAPLIIKPHMHLISRGYILGIYGYIPLLKGSLGWLNS